MRKPTRVGAELGADDYVSKPFSLRELVARVRAVLRRPPHVNTPERVMGYKRGPLDIDFDAVSVSVSGSAVRLTKREFQLLCFLVENRNRVISRDRLLERVWGLDRQVETRSVDVHVGRLRGKLGSAAANRDRHRHGTASSRARFGDRAGLTSFGGLAV